MSQLEDGQESYYLEDKCVVPWNDGSIYAGKVQKILDPARKVVIQGTPSRKGGKTQILESTTSLDKIKNDRHERVPSAVITESLKTKQKWFYVHYFGWKTNYDEWLPAERMLPYTPRNINEMHRVNAEIKERERLKKEEEIRQKKNKKRPASAPVPSASGSSKVAASSPSRLPKRRNISTEPEGRQSSPSVDAIGNKSRRRVVLSDGPVYEIRLSVPLELKRLLVKDWRLVTRDREIVKLPRPVSVVAILKDFANATVPDKESGDYENMLNFVDSMITYFDYAFGMMLLYRFERNHYYAQRHSTPNFRPSLIYGAEHLARLIVSMPSLLSQLSSMDDITLQYIVKQLEKLSVFITDHRVRYFAGEQTYDSVTRIYETLSVPSMVTEPLTTQNSEEPVRAGSATPNEED